MYKESVNNEKLELCKKIKSYGFTFITALNCKYDFCSVFAKECTFDYVEKMLNGEKLEIELDTETLENFIDIIEKYIEIDKKQQ